MLNILARIIQAKLENMYGGVRNISTAPTMGAVYNDLSQVTNENSSLTNFSYLVRALEDINPFGINLHLLSNFIAILGSEPDHEVAEAALMVL